MARGEEPLGDHAGIDPLNSFDALSLLRTLSLVEGPVLYPGRGKPIRIMMFVMSPHSQNQERPSWKEAAAWSLGVSLLLNLVYSGCNWLTSFRSGVGHLYFDWELEVPFVALMLVPYLSINLFFMAAFFLCETRGELATLGKRIALATAVAAACFLVFPLELGFAPVADPGGFLGLLFRFLHGVDRAYNCCPSLHITFWIILGELYFRKSKGIARLLTMCWFSIVGPSTILVHQHHVADIVGGIVLGTLCLGFFGPNPA